MDEEQCSRDLMQLLGAMHGSIMGVRAAVPEGPEQRIADFTLKAIGEAASEMGPDNGVWMNGMEIVQIATFVGTLVGLTVSPGSHEPLIRLFMKVVKAPEHPVTQAIIKHVESGIEVGKSLCSRVPEIVVMDKSQTVDASQLN